MQSTCPVFFTPASKGINSIMFLLLLRKLIKAFGIVLMKKRLEIFRLSDDLASHKIDIDPYFD